MCETQVGYGNAADTDTRKDNMRFIERLAQRPQGYVSGAGVVTHATFMFGRIWIVYPSRLRDKRLTGPVNDRQHPLY
jgi:hypothetical protein